MNIAERGRQSFADALTGTMSHCDVSEWLDDAGEMTRIYWRPLTGADQLKIEAFEKTVDRTLMMVKVRARDESGSLIFSGVAIESLRADYDYNVMRAIAYLMLMDVGNDVDEKLEVIEKE